jgi:hypothetical protein
MDDRPTYGWGSLEYGSGTGSVLGGRWKPSHYMLARAFANVAVACSAAAECFVKVRDTIGRQGDCEPPPLLASNGCCRLYVLIYPFGAKILAQTPVLLAVCYRMTTHYTRCPTPKLSSPLSTWLTAGQRLSAERI